MSLSQQLLWRDLRLAYKSMAELVQIPVFYLIVASLFPLAIGGEAEQLARLAPGIIWVTVLLSAILGAQRLLHDDAVDGYLEQWLLLPGSLTWHCFIKIMAQWLLTSLPVILLTPLLALQFQLPVDSMGVLMLALAVGTPALSALVALGASLSLGARQSTGLVALLVLPLCVPVLVFGVAGVEAVNSGQSAEAHLSLLAAFTIFTLSTIPFAMAKSIRLALDY
ncbi:MAG: hypothetical protein RLZZ502_672 [Pseudomonadota bacterium]